MNIVCYSAQFPPSNTPESFCTARFLSALAENGCHVHLLTLDHPQELDDSIVAELVSPKIKITRLPHYQMVQESVWKRFLKRKQLPYDWRYWGPKSLLKILSDILNEYDNPILHTRSDPLEPQFIMPKIRHKARLWIPHFADPIPLPFRDIVEQDASIYGKVRNYRRKRNLISVIEKADIVSVTCRNAIRYFNEFCGGGMQDKFHLNYHVGVPRLSPGDFQYEKRDKDTFEVVHVGSLLKERYPGRVIEEFRKAVDVNPKIRLTLFGSIDGLPQDVVEANAAWLRVINDRKISPRDATDLQSQCDMSMVVDAETVLSYCPFLASKFAYAVDLEKPVLCVTVDDSEMAKLYREYGSIYYADISKEGSLAGCLIRGAAEPLETPNASLRSLFSPETIAEKFMTRIDTVLQGK